MALSDSILEYECERCKQREKDHIEGKCPFAPTHYIQGSAVYRWFSFASPGMVIGNMKSIVKLEIE